MGRVAMWYAVCTVVGAASSWIGGFFIALVVIVGLLLYGVILAYSSRQPQMLSIHHAIIGLAVSLAVSHVFPLAIFAFGPGF